MTDEISTMAGNLELAPNYAQARDPRIVPRMGQGLQVQVPSNTMEARMEGPEHQPIPESSLHYNQEGSNSALMKEQEECD